MNHFYDINAEINTVCKMSPRIFLYPNFIFLPSHIITQYIGDMYRISCEKRGYETRWFYDAVVTENVFLVGTASRTRSREEHFISDIRKRISNVEDINRSVTFARI